MIFTGAQNVSTEPIEPNPMSIGWVNYHPLAVFLPRLLSRPAWSIILAGAGLLGLFISLLAAVQFATPALAGNDGYYHIKLAQVMREQGLRPPFPWLPLTVLNPEAYVDHHFLYHVLLIPFTYGDLRLGAKWATVILPAFTFLVGWILLRGQRVPYAALWSLGFLAISDAFLYRMSMARAQSVSLLILLLALHLTLVRRYRWLLPLSFLYVWLYDAFPLMLLVTGSYVAARLCLDRRFEPAPLLYAGLGVGLGLLINPYFPDNLLFIYHHLFPKLTDATATSVGKEWYPYQTWTLVENSGLALLLFGAGTFALGLQERRMDVRTATTFLLCLLFGAMLFKSRRFVEYFPAFVLLFAALAWTPLIQAWLKGQAWRVNLNLPSHQPTFHLHWVAPGHVWRPLILIGVMMIVLGPALWFTVRETQKSLQDSKPYQSYAAASAWLEANTPARSRVFQTDWDDFTRLYFYNTHNTYTVGLDPTYMQLYDAGLYELWIDITRGRVEHPARDIKETFGANYVITDLNHTGFLREAKADPDLHELYRDKYAVIFQVLSQDEPQGK